MNPKTKTFYLYKRLHETILDCLETLLTFAVTQSDHILLMQCAIVQNGPNWDRKRSNELFDYHFYMVSFRKCFFFHFNGTKGHLFYLLLCHESYVPGCLPNRTNY